MLSNIKMKNVYHFYTFAIICIIIIVLTTFKLYDGERKFGYRQVNSTFQDGAQKFRYTQVNNTSQFIDTQMTSERGWEQKFGYMPNSKLQDGERSTTSQVTESVVNETWLSPFMSDEECPSVLKKKKMPKTRGCLVPEIDPFHPSIMRYIKQSAYPNCPGSTYGKLWNGTLTFTDPNVVSASYQPILRNGDFKYTLGETITVDSRKISDEFVEVNYILKDGRTVKDFLYQVLPHDHLLKREGTKKPGIPLNIMVIGIDSLSYGNARRTFPKLYEFLKDDLDALFFMGHTVVGDGTTPQLTAMLTGKHVGEQHEARTGRHGAKPLDNWNWVFKDLKEHGYLTGFSEDGVWDGPFQYRLLGFTKPPTDFYPRPFFLDVARRTKLWTDRCINNRNIAKIHLDYAKVVFDSFPKKLKFFFSFNAGFSHHEINHARKSERDTLLLIKDLKTNGYLDNTLLIVMGDHGLRFGPVRSQVQGKLEERLPFYSMVFPSAFRSKYPSLMNILKMNTDRLTSWFDVHATFLHMLSYPVPPRDLKHGLSLFTEIPANRTCKDADVSTHWCPCLEWETVDAKHTHIRKAGLAAVAYMNDLIAQNNASRVSCAVLSLKSVNFAQLERPNKQVMEVHGGSKQRQSSEYLCRYQLQFVTSPSEGVFEATVKYSQKQFIVSTSISRINQYGDQPKCVAAKLPHVRKYCLCKDYSGIL